ncbi:MAG: DUF1614 domain-containing protein [Chloroflexota bacterium]
MAGWFPLGSVILVILGVSVYFGLVHGVLDRMRLNDRTALAAIMAIILGSFLTVPLVRGPNQLAINVGGAVVPLIVGVYLIVTADTAAEKARALVGVVVTGAAVYAVGKIVPVDEPGVGFLDPLYIHALFAGTVGYLAGRSRRAAFIAGSMGTVLADLAHYLEVTARGLSRTNTVLGGAGAFDATVVAAVLAVVLAEIVGETREYLGGGPRRPSQVRLDERLRSAGDDGSGREPAPGRLRLRGGERPDRGDPDARS